MYCRKCGKEIADFGICPDCGFENIELKVEGIETDKDLNIHYNERDDVSLTSKDEKSIKKVPKFLIIIVIVILFFVISFLGIGFFLYKSFNNIKSMEYIELNNVEIPTYYYFTKEKRNVCRMSSYSNSDYKSKQISYCDSLPRRELEEYVDYLIDKYGYELCDGEHEYNLMRKYSSFVVVVNLDSKDFGYFYYYGSKEGME